MTTREKVDDIVADLCWRLLLAEIPVESWPTVEEMELLALERVVSHDPTLDLMGAG